MGKSFAGLGLGDVCDNLSLKRHKPSLVIDFLERKGFLIPKKEAHEKMAPLEPWISWSLDMALATPDLVGIPGAHSQHAKESTKKQETSLNYCIK